MRSFPEDFVAIARRLPDRLQAKDDRETEEGRALRALREIRVRAAPSWDADAVGIQLWFIREPDDGAPGGERGEAFLEAWLELVTPGGRFRSVDGFVTSLDDLTARDYVESDPLDLDHLSARER